MRTVIFALSALLCMCIAISTQAATITVDDDGPADFSSIQAAINNANDGDTVLVNPGRYIEAINFNGKAITVTGTDPNNQTVIEATIIDANNLDSVVKFENSEGPDSVLTGLLLTKGHHFYNGNTRFIDGGGGIYCSNSSPTISKCTITGNTTSHYTNGGGICCLNGSPVISECLITENSAFSDNGGGIFCFRGSPTIKKCNITNNYCGISGGGIYCYQNNAIIIECTISGNSGGMFTDEGGGGIYCFSDYGEISKCVITNNSINGNGGGIFINIGRPEISQCQIADNTARSQISSGGNGGGIFVYNDWGVEVSISNSLIAGNRADLEGGGLSGRGYEISNCTIVKNHANNSGGGISCYSSHITNSIIRSNIPDEYDISSIYITYSCVPGISGGEGNIDADPLFVDFDANDFHLQYDSPCIDAVIANPAQFGETDIDGQPRIMGDAADMGVDEAFIQTITVTNPADGETWVQGSLRQIVWNSSIYEGTVDILFSDGDYWQIIDIAQTASGSLLWEVPAGVDSDQCFIIATPSITDETFVIRESGTFTIKPDDGGSGLPGKWETLGGSFDRKGAGSFAGPELGCVKWNFETAGAVSASVTIGSDDQIYIPCEDANLYAVDPNGDPLWTFKADSPLISSATIGPDGSIYVGSSSGRLYAIDAYGYLRWTYDTAGPVYSSPAISADGTTIFVGSGDGKLYTFADDGTMLWNHQVVGAGKVTTGSIMASPSIGPDSTVYIGGEYDPNLYALDPNGTVKWNCQFASGGCPASSPVVGPDGTIYQTLASDPNLYAIDPNGSIAWAVNLADTDSGWYEMYRRNPVVLHNQAYHLSDSGYSESAIAPDGTIYASLSDPYLRAVDPNGTIKWVTRLGMMGGFTLTIGTDGLIYAASDDGYMSVVDPNGSELARLKSDEWLGNPVIADDGTIILADMQEKSMFKAATANAVWAINSQPCSGKVLRRPYDVHEDTGVDLTDYASLAQYWLGCTDLEFDYEMPSLPCLPWYGQNYLTGDIDRDFFVDTEDLKAIADNWLSQD